MSTAKALYKFALPKSLHVRLSTAPGAPEEIVTAVFMQEVSIVMEANAAERARNSLLRLPAELALGALAGAEINGQFRALNEADGSGEKFLSDVGPKVRSLVVSAYSSVNNVEPEDSAAFLGSRALVTM